MILQMSFEDDVQSSEQTYIECEHEQGSAEWHLDRLGIPTGSGYSKIITATGKPSASAEAYMNQLLADREAGKPVDAWEGNEYTKNGNEREPLAREFYEFITGNSVEQIGFCFYDEKKETGVSPDGLVGDDGLLEIKCPKASTLIGYRRSGKLPAAYFQQIQGQLWVMRRKWCDFLAWHPEIKHFMIRVKRDEQFISALEREVSKFNILMKEVSEGLTDE